MSTKDASTEKTPAGDAVCCIGLRGRAAKRGRRRGCRGYRGFLSAVIFLLFFLMFFSTVQVYVSSVEKNEHSIAVSRRTDRLGAIADDIAASMRSFFELSVKIWKDVENSSILFTNAIPTSLDNPPLELSAYKSFLEGSYANQTNAFISFDVSRLSAPFIFLEGYNLNYSWNNLTRNSFFVFGASNITSYFMQGSLNDVCQDAACSTTAVSWQWVECNANTVYFKTNIRDANNVQAKIKAQYDGCVSITVLNLFSLDMKNGGRLSVSVGNVSSYSPAIRISTEGPLQYFSNLTINVSNSFPTIAWLPAGLAIDGAEIPNLILLEK